MSHTDERCDCTLAISLVGSGCRYCQPQEYIDRLHDQIKEDEFDRDNFESRVGKVFKDFQYLIKHHEIDV